MLLVQGPTGLINAFRQVSLFTVVMNACYTVGDMDAIISLGGQMRAQNITLDPGAYHLMITSHISKLVSRSIILGRSSCARRFMFHWVTAPASSNESL